MHIQIQKRDGSLQPLEISKIVYRIDSLIKGNDELNNKIGEALDIDANCVALEVCQHVKDKIKSTELDEITAEICAFKVLESPDYNHLANRLVISNNHKNNRDYVSLVTLTNVLNSGTNSGRYSSEYLEIVGKHGEALDQVLDFTRDYKYLDYFGYKTLEKNYLLSTIINKHTVRERPQHLWMRVAIEIHRHDLERVIRTYHRLSEFYYMHATPTLFNSGHAQNQLSSCNLMGATTNSSGKLGKSKDTVETMYETARRIALISKNAGGIGLWGSDIRGRNASINNTGGRGSGLVPYIRSINDVCKHIDQGGKRKGSIAIYLEPWYSDIFEFLELKKNTGPEELRARDVFMALFINNIFMKRLKIAINKDESDEEPVIWSIMCPYQSPGLIELYGDEFDQLYEKYEKEGKYVKQVNILDLWEAILTSQMETGVPYMVYKDAVNEKSNQKNLGTIKSSNLCVSGDTYVLTDKGQHQISTLVNQNVNVWNGKDWSNTIVLKTGEDQELMQVELSNGVALKVTPYHKFYIMSGGQKTKEVRTHELTSGDKLIKYDLPVTSLEVQDKMKYPYTHGLFCGDGTTYPSYSGHKNYPKLYLYGEKKDLLPFVDYESYTDNVGQNRYDIVLPKDLDSKFTIPFNQDQDTILRWLEGYCDADGTICNNGENQSLQIASINKSFLLSIRLMLQTLGIDCKVTKSQESRISMLPDGKGGMAPFQCKEIFRLLISSVNLYKLCLLGFTPHRLTFISRKPQRESIQFVTIKSVSTLNDKEDTYCFTEPKRGMGMFNGVLTGNCAEIVQHSSYDEIASCNLASISLPKFINSDKPYGYDLELLAQIAGELTHNLNNVIDNEFYPLVQLQRGNFRHRPIGIGVQGLADVFFALKLPYESSEAQRLNLLISEAIYYGCVRSTIQLSKERSEQMAGLVNLSLEDRQKLVDTIAELELTRQNLAEFKRMHTEIEFAHEKAYIKTTEQSIETLQNEVNIQLEAVKIDKAKFNWRELMYWDPSRPVERWGTYSTFEGSPASQGLFHFDLSNYKPGRHFDWDLLKSNTACYGWRNSLLVAYMPTASTAQIMGNNECFEPITSNIYSRSVLSGNFMLVNKYLQADLIRLDLWKRDLIDEIIRARGSVQNISKIPKKLRELYKTSWEISKQTYLEMSRDRGYFTDQSQSLNLFIDDPTADLVTSVHLYGWELGLKTGSYYLRRKTVTNALQFSVESSKVGAKIETPAEGEGCLMCSG